MPPLEQPRSPVLPAGVFTMTLKLPEAGIMEDVMVTLSWELFVTVVARVAPLKTPTEEETKWLPVTMMTKLDGSCEKTMKDHGCWIDRVEDRCWAGTSAKGIQRVAPRQEQKQRNQPRTEAKAPIGR